ncbi:MAG: hypothetical protein CEO22_571 [Candidatus Berkelbacteria bacterium Gr01-1014_85]|uniref:Uncharacterized protein n=1 Tax=Candidatus Berkelbacteria bacterium Gr01-1014_85 TaxID=2017150 RepID=A0A554JA27_9BACT|nr:MAG: hypothetical protein CEO22_571 [Candidatus Berkelbacteria bacterium Gr01-1014_85]
MTERWRFILALAVVFGLISAVILLARRPRLSPQAGFQLDTSQLSLQSQAYCGRLRLVPTELSRWSLDTADGQQLSLIGREQAQVQLLDRYGSGKSIDNYLVSVKGVMRQLNKKDQTIKLIVVTAVTPINSC